MMSLMRPISQIASLTLAAAVVVTAQCAVAGSQYVVLSTEPVVDELPPGKVFAPSDVINVPAGTVVTLLGEDGSVNPISGPAAFVVTEDALTPNSSPRAGDAHAGPSNLALIANLLTNERQRSESIGSARTTADQSKPSGLDDPWAISIEESAPGCIRNGDVVLARRWIGERVVFSVRFGGGQSLTGLVWSAGKPTYSLPDPVPAQVKSFVVETNETSALIEIKVFPQIAIPQNPLDVLGWMVTSGCKRQALAFVRQLVTKQQ
jgi:hypothetical protein